MLEIVYRIYEVADEETKEKNLLSGIDFGLYSTSKAENIEILMDCLICDSRGQFKEIIRSEYRTPLNINKEGLILSCCFCTHHNGECKDFIAQHSPQTLTCKLLEDYTILWNSTVKKSDLAKYGWDANPWVWVVEFERVEVTE